MASDKNAPNLTIGKLIGNSRIEGKIISFDDDNIQIEITSVEDKYYQRYVDKGKTYPLFQHKYWTGDLLLWEVKPSAMKRDVSQLLLQWQKDIGWTWDLDM